MRFVQLFDFRGSYFPTHLLNEKGFSVFTLNQSLWAGLKMWSNTQPTFLPPNTTCNKPTYNYFHLTRPRHISQNVKFWDSLTPWECLQVVCVSESYTWIIQVQQVNCYSEVICLVHLFVRRTIQDEGESEVLICCSTCQTIISELHGSQGWTNISWQSAIVSAYSSTDYSSRQTCFACSYCTNWKLYLTFIWYDSHFPAFGLLTLTLMTLELESAGIKLHFTN